MKLISCRNNVYLQGDRIIKHFSDQQALQRELSTIELLKRADVAVAELLAINENSLEYRFIDGVTYYSLLECFEAKHAAALVNWLQEYYRATGMLRGDVNLRNFIYVKSTDSCIGIDFEDIPMKGKQETDYGKIIAFAATYHPPFSDKLRYCAKLLLNEFINSGADLPMIHTAYQAEIKDIKQRRNNQQYNLDQAELFWQSL